MTGFAGTGVAAGAAAAGVAVALGAVEEAGVVFGAELLVAAERWAVKNGCKSMSVRSNVIRDRAHAFYLRNGYEHYKTQKAFRKSL